MSAKAKTQAVEPARQRAEAPSERGFSQRKCACGQHAPGGLCAGCAGWRGATLQRATAPAVRAAVTPSVPEIVHDVLRSPGRPLDAAARGLMESRFDHDLSGVRVHTDARAAGSALAVGAHAYTVGRDIVFGAGRYEPQTPAGMGLLAHELTHVVQQRHLPDAGASAQIELGPEDDSFEREARGRAAPAGASSLRGPRLQRGSVGSFFGELFSIHPGPINALRRLFGAENYSKEELQSYLDDYATEGKTENRYDSDNKARAIVGRAAEFKEVADTQVKITLIEEMLSGITAGADERAILKLLRGAAWPGELKQIVAKVGRARLWDEFSGANLRALKGLTLTPEDFQDTKYVESLKGLSAGELTDYRDNSPDPAVRERLEKILKMQKITMPLGLDATFDAAGEATLNIGNAIVVVKPDMVSTEKKMGSDATTGIQIVETGLTGLTYDTRDGKVEAVQYKGDGKVKFEIQTVYGPEAVPSGPSGYGRGTTGEDVRAGQTSVKFHESRHGLDQLEYIKAHPLPTLKWTQGVTTEDEFLKAVNTFNKELDDYQLKLAESSVKKTDCPGNPISKEQLEKYKFRINICEETATGR